MYRRYKNGHYPTPAGTTITSRLAHSGERFNLVFSSGQTRPGGFGTFDDIGDQAFARQKLAITGVILTSGASRSQIEVALGLNKGSLRGGELVRIDITDPFARNLRLPDPKLGNSHQRPDTGRTTGNLHEAVINSLKSDPWILYSVIPRRG